MLTVSQMAKPARRSRRRPKTCCLRHRELKVKLSTPALVQGWCVDVGCRSSAQATACDGNHLKADPRSNGNPDNPRRVSICSAPPCISLAAGRLQSQTAWQVTLANRASFSPVLAKRLAVQ